MVAGNGDHGFDKGRPLLANVIGFFEDMTSTVAKRTSGNITDLGFGLISVGFSQTYHSGRTQRWIASVESQGKAKWLDRGSEGVVVSGGRSNWCFSPFDIALDVP